MGIKTVSEKVCILSVVTGHDSILHDYCTGCFKVTWMCHCNNKTRNIILQTS